MDGRRLTGPRACGSLSEKSKLAMPSLIVTVTASFTGRSTTTPSLSSSPTADDSPCGSLAIDSRRAHLRDTDLRRHVAAHQRGLAAVRKNDALDIALRHARCDDLDRRHQQALLEYLGGVCRRRAGNRAADVGLVRDR